MMTFMNELTWARAEAEGRTEECHRAYGSAAEELLSQVGGTTIAYPNHVNGLPSLAAKTFRDVSPIDRELTVGIFQRSSPDDVDRAVTSARDAFIEWSREDWTARVKVFEKAAGLMRRQKFALASAITLDNGKERYEALGDVDEAIDFLEYYCSEMRRTDGFTRTTDPAYPGEEVSIQNRPYGAWAVICPFNFPFAITAGMTAGALITGNAAVVKPSSAAPLPVHLFYEIMDQAGLPPGVLNLVAGSGSEAGDALTAHPGIDGIAFTGSREVGERIIRASSNGARRPVIAEMGSKNPVIVSGEADLEMAAKGIAAAAFSYSGQKCSACSRLYVHESVYGPLLSRLREETAKLQVGDPFERTTSIGPVITEKAADNYLAWSAMARRDGKVVYGGKRAEVGRLSRGNYVTPTIVEALPEEHELMRRELFVPILCVQRYRTLQDAVVRANASEFGLTAGIFSNNDVEVKYFFDTIQSGVVYANRERGATTGAMVGAQAFAGWKASGSTGHGTGSRHYLPQFMREQSRTLVKR